MNENQFLYELFGGVLVIPMLQMTVPFPTVYELGVLIGILSIIVSLLEKKKKKTPPPPPEKPGGGGGGIIW